MLQRVIPRLRETPDIPETVDIVAFAREAGHSGTLSRTS
jgi:hypothetical protein